IIVSTISARRPIIGKFYNNFRREDSISTACRLHDRLSQTFGRKNIFMDVDHIPAGVDFVAHLNSQIVACKIALVVIGPRWLEAKDESGGGRLEKPDGFLTNENAKTLAPHKPCLPVLFDRAGMAQGGERPGPL